MGTPVVEFRNVTKVFGSNKVIDNLSYAIKKGSFVTLLGPSGCGKTTLLRMLAGFYEPDGGEIYINGERIDAVPAHLRNTAMVFQEYALFPHLTVFENVAYGLKVRKETARDIYSKVIKALELMQLSGLGERYPYQLSGGQQQRVALARALVMNPVALLLDEPLSNLDAKLREAVRVELRMIQKKLGLTMIYVTHDQQEALSMSDEIVVMEKGVIHQFGTPQEIYYYPRTKFVADFIGTTNLIKVEVKTVKENTLTLKYENNVFEVVGNNGYTSGDAIDISIRPECLKISLAADENKLCIPGTIQHAMFLGEKIRYIVKDAYQKEWIVDNFDSGSTIFDGDVWLQSEKEKLHLIGKVYV